MFTPVNSFCRTRDGREIFFNGAYQHLRNGILRFLDCPSDREAIARRVAVHDAQALEDELSALGPCAAVKRSPEEWRAHPQGQALAGVPYHRSKLPNSTKVIQCPSSPLRFDH